MKFDKTISFYKNEAVSDGAGGTLPPTQVFQSEVKGLITPVSSQHIYKEYGLTVLQGFKIITKGHVEPDLDYIISVSTLGKQFKVLSMSQAGLYTIILVESVVNG